MKWRDLSDLRPRTAARLLGVSRRQALALIRYEQTILFDDVIAVLPCGVGMRRPTMDALERMKGGSLGNAADGRLM